jgi:hypothetical protein
MAGSSEHSYIPFKFHKSEDISGLVILVSKHIYGLGTNKNLVKGPDGT